MCNRARQYPVLESAATWRAGNRALIATVRVASPRVPSPAFRSDPMADTTTPRRLVIATRESALALWQAQHIRGRLAQLYPACEVSLLGLCHRGHGRGVVARVFVDADADVDLAGARIGGVLGHEHENLVERGLLQGLKQRSFPGEQRRGVYRRAARNCNG